MGQSGPISVRVSESGVGRTLLLLASLGLGVVGLYWIVDAFVVDGQLRFGNPPATTPQPRHVLAEVTRVEGRLSVKVGDECNFLVEKYSLAQGEFQCRAQVVCGGTLLYGGPQRGYFVCALHEEPRRDVVGSDPATTRLDGDPALQLDTRRGLLRLRDDAYGHSGPFAVEAEVLDVR